MPRRPITSLRYARTIAFAVACLSIGAVSPSVAAGVFADNSDKVDGKHAVGAGASVANRAGKLVATNSNGRLPNNIIVRALDSGKLGGQPASSYARDLVQVVGSNVTITGTSGISSYGTASVTCPSDHPVFVSGDYTQSDGVPSIEVFRSSLSGSTYSVDGQNVSGTPNRNFHAWAICSA